MVVTLERRSFEWDGSLGLVGWGSRGTRPHLLESYAMVSAFGLVMIIIERVVGIRWLYT